MVSYYKNLPKLKKLRLKMTLFLKLSKAFKHKFNPRKCRIFSPCLRKLAIYAGLLRVTSYSIQRCINMCLHYTYTQLVAMSPPMSPHHPCTFIGTALFLGQMEPRERGRAQLRSAHCLKQHMLSTLSQREPPKTPRMLQEQATPAATHFTNHCKVIQ